MSEKYAWSLNGEHFQGEYDSRKEAIRESLFISTASIGDLGRVYTGMIVEPGDFIGKKALGERVLSDIRDTLYDEVDDAADNFKWSDYDEMAIGELIIGLVERNIGFQCWKVVDIEEHEESIKEK